MARIAKRDHAAILQMIDVEQRKVSEVAAEYGCSTANIYALLSKLRRAAGMAARRGGDAEPPPSLPLNDQQDAPAADAARPDLFAAAAEPLAEPPSAAPPQRQAEERQAAASNFPSAHDAPAAQRSAPDRATATVTELPRKGPITKKGGVGATLAKPGFGLTMRTEEGDESMTPFRSLEDLLSAVKPILRASARSQDPVWFSIKPIDLSTLEFDAA